ncbi:MAG TPA: hypothetical protein VM431_00805 [Phycisphaerae bacterium]|nr:hypothetical protein [Phycisphaerae bacterium]
MSTDAQTQMGPSQPSGFDADAAGVRQEPQTLIRESIKYRRRAQDAERRAEGLDAEISNLRRLDEERAAALETELGQVQGEAEALRAQVADIQRDRNLERALAKAGCADTETALALARQRLTQGDLPEDLAAFAKALLEEKPCLRGTASARPAAVAPPLPPRTSGAKPAGENAPGRAAQRLAERARQTGSPGDVMAYMRVRRAVGT